MKKDQVIVPIKKRNREYNLFTWPYEKDFEIKTLLSQEEEIDLYIFDDLLKGRTVDYKYRRINIGKRNMQKLKGYNYFKLEKMKDNIFKISGVEDL